MFVVSSILISGSLLVRYLTSYSFQIVFEAGMLGDHRLGRRCSAESEIAENAVEMPLIRPRSACKKFLSTFRSSTENCLKIKY